MQLRLQLVQSRGYYLSRAPGSRKATERTTTRAGGTLAFASLPLTTRSVSRAGPAHLQPHFLLLQLLCVSWQAPTFLHTSIHLKTTAPQSHQAPATRRTANTAFNVFHKGRFLNNHSSLEMRKTAQKLINLSKVTSWASITA